MGSYFLSGHIAENDGNEPKITVRCHQEGDYSGRLPKAQLPNTTLATVIDQVRFLPGIGTTG